MLQVLYTWWISKVFFRWQNACVIKVKGILLNLISDKTVLLSSAELLWDFYSNFHLFCHSFMFWLLLCSLSGLTSCYPHLNDDSRGWNALQVCWWLSLEGIGGGISSGQKTSVSLKWWIFLNLYGNMSPHVTFGQIPIAPSKKNG